jgi:hypothetical protein
MKVPKFLINVYHFYKDGFRNMTLGKTLWAIILVKLFIMFGILKVFFFPDLLRSFKSEDEKAKHVQTELIDDTQQKK